MILLYLNSAAFFAAAVLNWNAFITRSYNAASLFRGVLATVYFCLYFSNAINLITQAERFKVGQHLTFPTLILVWIFPAFVIKNLPTVMFKRFKEGSKEDE